VPISITPEELRELIVGSRAVFEALGGEKNILPEEQPTIDFAYASVVTTLSVRAGERFTRDNLWVKRPGTGEIHATRYEEVLGRVAQRDIAKDALLSWSDIGG
jgi:N-acetylneuraminate synthase